jgi:hypothetical protein
MIMCCFTALVFLFERESLLAHLSTDHSWFSIMYSRIDHIAVGMA